MIISKVLTPMDDIENPHKIFCGEKEFMFDDLEKVQFPHFNEIRTEIRNQFWIASEVDMTPDVKQFPTLTAQEQDAFLKIIGLLATLDAPQTALASQIASATSDPVVRMVMDTIADQESEHNHSYAYVLSSVTDLAGQIESFEMGRRDPVLLERNKRIVEVYNTFATERNVKQDHQTEKEYKRIQIGNALNAMIYTSLLEGMYFYSAFAYFYNLARHNKMVATSTMISFINRDELQHARFISELYRAVLGENPELNTPERTEWVYDQFRHNVSMEDKWTEYVLDGIEGIDTDQMKGYIRYRGNKLLRMLGYEEIFEGYEENPMMWIKAYVDNFDGVKTDFFEQKSRQYTKTSDLNGFDDL